MDKREKQHGSLRFPEFGTEDSFLLDYKDRYFNFWNVYRCRHMERMAQALWYQLSRQWVELDNEILVDGVRGYFFRDLQASSQAEMPRPVTNYIAPSVETELASLGKRQLTPTVLTTSRDPRIQAAAKVAKEILQDRMRKLGWDEIRDLSIFLTVVTGTGCIKSYWDETYADLTPVGSPYAASCPTCGTVLSSTKVSKSLLETTPVKNSELIRDVPPESMGEEEAVELNHCPTCDDPIPLQKYDVGEDEVNSQASDFFGRPLGLLVPKGNTAMEAVSPFELFPQNSGIGITPETCKIWGQASTRSMDWIEERYPDFVHEVQPDDPYELMRSHPLLGEWSLLGHYHPSYDSGIFDDHAKVFELHHEKTFRFPEGATLVIAGGKVLEFGPLYKTVGGIAVPKVAYAGARFKPRHGEFWGHSLVDDLISVQNRINGMDAQVIDARERMGSPNMAIPDDMEVNGPEFFSEWGGGKWLRYRLSALNPNAKPEVLEGRAMNQEVWRERDQAIADIKHVAGPQDIEQGEAPRNISTTSGLQLLGEQAERRRAPRERSLIMMYEKIWSHQLRLIWAYRSEKDEYDVETPEGEWETKQYDRNAVQGQNKVIIEKQAYVDKSLYQREGTREAQADLLYDVTTQAAKKKILELRGLPTDVNEDLNRQVDLGKQQWVDFVEEGIIPIIDETIDAHRIRYQELATFLLSDEGKRLEKAVGWPEVSRILGSKWKDELMNMEMMDQAAFQFYGSRMGDPAAQQEQFAQGQIQYQEQQAANQELEQQAGEAGVGVPITPAQPPPPPMFLPAAKQDKVLMVWMQMLQMAGMEISPELQVFLQFSAAVDAYKLLAEEQEMAMMVGMMSPAPAPGTPAGSGDAAGGVGAPPNPANPANVAPLNGPRAMNLQANGA